MDKVIVKDVSGGIQKHDCKKAVIDFEKRVLWIRCDEKSQFGYNMDNLISYSILNMDKDKTTKEEI